MLSSLARRLGLGNHVSEPGDLGSLAVLAVWAPGQASWSNQIEMEGAIAVCLDMVGKETSMFRFPSDRICHHLATALKACKLNSQQFTCWFSEVNAPPDVAMTIAASLVELGMVGSATVQYEPLVTTVEGSLCNFAPVSSLAIIRLYRQAGGRVARTGWICPPERLLTSATLKGVQLCSWINLEKACQ